MANGIFSFEILGSGSSSIVYKYVKDDVVKVIKKSKSFYHSQYLLQEYNFFKSFQDEEIDAREGIPIVYNFDKSNNLYSMEMELLGDSLETLFVKCKLFSMKTICMIAIQLITRLQQLHIKGLLHGDIKGDNFLIGKENPNIIYIVDLSCAKSITSRLTENNSFIGNLRHASINVHRGIRMDRRDDLESLGYLFVYFYKGSLPWKIKTDFPVLSKNRFVELMKVSITTKELCDGMPEEFINYFDHIKSLTFGDIPDYNFLRQLFVNIMNTNNFIYDYNFDWNNQ